MWETWINEFCSSLCAHLGSEPADRSYFSVSLVRSLSKSALQIKIKQVFEIEKLDEDPSKGYTSSLKHLFLFSKILLIEIGINVYIPRIERCKLGNFSTNLEFQVLLFQLLLVFVNHFSACNCTLWYFIVLIFCTGRWKVLVWSFCTVDRWGYWWW